MNSRLLVFPPQPATALTIARRLRTDGFWSLPQPVWNNAADLVEHLSEHEPTVKNRLWLWDAHEAALKSGDLQ
jgi:hypothetical protein